MKNATVASWDVDGSGEAGMTVVSARPAALRRYGAGLEVADQDLRVRAEGLREVLARYARSSPELGGDHTEVADLLERLAVDATALNRWVHQVAAAFERFDVLPGAVREAAGVGALPDGVRRVSPERFERSYGTVASAWSRVEYLGELVEDLDAERWRDLVWGSRRLPPCLGGYAGGGAVRGPDGRLYPLVIPELEIDGVLAHVSYSSEAARDPATLGGADPDWVVVDEITGVARVNPYAPGHLARAAAFAGVAAGQVPVRQAWASPEQLATVTFGPTGRPQLTLRDPHARLGHDPRGTHVPPPSESGPGPRRRGLGVVETAATLAEGYQQASELHHPGINVYRVLFERHEDGSRRARMHTYQLATTEAGSVFVPYMGHAVEGTLRRKLVTPAPERRNVMSQRGGATGRGGGAAVSPRRSSRPAAP